MVINNIERYVAVGKELILYSKKGIDTQIDLKIRYRINKEEKEIRLFDVPRVLTFQEKAMIYYALLDKYYFYPLRVVNRELEKDKIETFVVKENGYTYHQFNSIDEKDNGILAELLFEIPRQEVEPEKLSRLRDIYEMLIRNKNELGKSPICIAFNGIMPDFKDVYRVINYMFETDKELVKHKDKCVIFKRNGLFGGNKRIFIVPKTIIEE